MLKVISLKTTSAIALSLTMMLGSLLSTPATSAFAKIKYGPAADEVGRGSYQERKIDKDTSTVQPYLIMYYSSTNNGRAEGKRVILKGK